MKKALVFTVFVLFSFLNAGTLLAADWSDGTGGAIYYNGGNVGIGTATPTEELEVDGNIKAKTIKADYLKDIIGVTVQEGYYKREIGARLDETDGNGTIWRYRFTPFSNGYLVLQSTKDNWESEPANMFEIGKDEAVLFPSGNVGIGTANPQSKLAVNGTITAKEVVVSTEGWSDYVFKDDYKLMPLNELERNIKENGHLPEIPSAEEVKEQGVSLGEMQAKLLQKVEELTLYMIELKKENELLKQQVASLQKSAQ
jgi:hypothetical protein